MKCFENGKKKINGLNDFDWYKLKGKNHDQTI